MDKQLEEEAVADLNEIVEGERQALYQLISDLELIVIDDHAAIDFAFANETLKRMKQQHVTGSPEVR